MLGTAGLAKASFQILPDISGLDWYAVYLLDLLGFASQPSCSAEHNTAAPDVRSPSPNANSGDLQCAQLLSMNIIDESNIKWELGTIRPFLRSLWWHFANGGRSQEISARCFRATATVTTLFLKDLERQLSGNEQ